MSAFNPNKKYFPALQKYVRNNSPRDILNKVKKLSWKDYFAKISILRRTLEYFEKHKSYLSSQLYYQVLPISLSAYLAMGRLW